LNARENRNVFSLDLNVHSYVRGLAATDNNRCILTSDALNWDTNEDRNEKDDPGDGERLAGRY